MRPIHFLTPFALTATAFAGGGIDATLNEIRVDNVSSDTDEYFELTGTPGTSLAGVWLVVIGDGAGDSGTVERGLDLSAMSIQPDGYLSVGHATMTTGVPDELLSPTSNFFENSDNLTFLLVDAFTGSAGDDLDTDDDGVLDVTPWASIYDSVAFVENFDTPASGEHFYSATTVGPDGTFAVAHASRCPDGPGGVWTVQSFDLGSNDTPGDPNDCSPANNDCSTPESAGLGATPFDNSFATSLGFDGGGPCSAAINQDMFYTFTAAADDTYTIDTCGSGFDTRIAVHAGVDCSALCIADNDDSCGTASSVAVPMLTGETVLVQVGGFGANSGAGVLNINGAAPPPANDTCLTPEVIAGEGVFAYDRTSATSSGFDGGDGVTTCEGAVDGGSGNFDVFFAWTPAVSGDYTIDTSSEGNDTNTDVHLGADCTATCLVDSDPATFTFSGAVSGTAYLIQIGNWNDTGTGNGPGTLDITLNAMPPANDTCATPAAAALGANPFDNTTATTSSPANTCGGEVIGNDLFYTYVVAADGDYTFDTIGTTYDSEISVSLGADCSAVCVGTDDFNGAGNDVVDVIGALTGETYLVRVGGWQDGVNGATGVLNISVTIPPPPPPANNDCSTPEAIAAEGTYVYNNEFATNSGFDGGDPLLCHSPTNPDLDEFGQQHNDLFWAFTVPCDGDYQFDTTGSTGFDDSRLSVHLGADCSATCVASNDDIDTGGGNYLSQVDLAGLVAGDTYLIQVGLWNDTEESGDGLLNITNTSGACPTTNVLCDPANDHFFGGYVDLSGSTFGSGVGSDLHLSASGGPPLGAMGAYASWGFFIASADGSGSTTVNKGILCLGDPGARYNAQVATNQGLPQLNSIGRFDAVGDLENFAGTSTTGYGFDVPSELPFTPMGQVIAPGDTVYFQLWYRDILAVPGDSSNFSNMLEVTF